MEVSLKALIIIIIISGLTITVNQNMPIKVNKDITQLNLDKVNNLMIVAHPDDETIWGGARLLQDDYLVVCITCGNKKRRAKEFKKVMEISNNQYIMLGYPDKVKGVRSDWKDHYSDISNDLKKIITYKNWNLIVTHNPNGEYGHDHHKMTNKIVTDIYNKKDNLYYFGKYYKPYNMKKIKNDLTKIDEKYLNIKKNKMIKVYKSQSFIEERFGHMFEYENWIKASCWKNNINI